MSKRCMALVAALACLVSTGIAPRAEICSMDDVAEVPILWVHDTFRGSCLQLWRSIPGFKSLDFNDEASSVTVPRGWTVILYEHTGYEGRTLTLTGPGDISDLKRDRPNGQNWGDTISSVKVFKHKRAHVTSPSFSTSGRSLYARLRGF
ncbi:MAG: beta/gamma crystallin family protein [bacterium]|nr:beta/gamma crystallin family protein [bacterium]